MHFSEAISELIVSNPVITNNPTTMIKTAKSTGEIAAVEKKEIVFVFKGLFTRNE